MSNAATVDAAFLLAREALKTNGEPPARFVFEEQAGLVAVIARLSTLSLVGFRMSS